ncbi:hypothetical protein G6F47_012695 [Rhizopus delemar]|nr:hypothetical protein G6F47_012695 [Rhizopus delemar]
MVNSNSNDWDDVLPIVQLASNYKIRHRSKSAPFSLMFARRLNSFEDYGDQNLPKDTAVMVRLPGRTSKLSPLYEGPYIVVRKTQGGSYVLKDEQNEL